MHEDLTTSLILFKGVPATLRIKRIYRLNIHLYRVYFKGKNTPYNYRVENVTWLTNPTYLDPKHHQIYYKGRELKELSEIASFSSRTQSYLRITGKTGRQREYKASDLRIVSSCLAHPEAKATFDYLKQVSSTNKLMAGGQELGDQELAQGTLGLLRRYYEQISFIDETSAAACYLAPERYAPQRSKITQLIYPFGCNASQKQAVLHALTSQISIIQGPPGTGKTQTILNIIANIVAQGKTALIVSGNNTAVENIQEKLSDHDLDFFVARLGSRANKEDFISHQPPLPESLSSWQASHRQLSEWRTTITRSLKSLDRVFALQEEQARLRQEEQALETEGQHFLKDHTPEVSILSPQTTSSSAILRALLQLQLLAEAEARPGTKRHGLSLRLRWFYLRLRYRRLGMRRPRSEAELQLMLDELQTLFYSTRQREIEARLAQIEAKLRAHDTPQLLEQLRTHSMKSFRASLAKKYREPRNIFVHTSELYTCHEELMREYPIVLSTTFSARNCLFDDILYDYVIMDEASQVSIDTGVLALTCARHAVIVGDTLQLPNVLSDEDRTTLGTIFESSHLPEAYDSARHSFLSSLCALLPSAPETLLREHYRCHPRIINFCNQKFYGGQLLIMTEDKGEEEVLTAIRTVKGNHATAHYNRREIDVIQEEVLPTLSGLESIGIITPYNHQVNALRAQLPLVEVATVHKYQGRERDAIIMSVVDNSISSFADGANLLNVAVSRAKKKFYLVVTGNEQSVQGNIMDLLDYILYSNGSIVDSQVASIFDYLYQQYTAERLTFLEKQTGVSEYVSERLTYALIQGVLASDIRYRSLTVLCHFPFRQLLRDVSLLSWEEKQYALHPSTHVDFLICSSVTKRPVLIIETDGYTYHQEGTKQHERDQKKDHILTLYKIPLLRLSTKGSGEEERLHSTLQELISQI